MNILIMLLTNVILFWIPLWYWPLETISAYCAVILILTGALAGQAYLRLLPFATQRNPIWHFAYSFALPVVIVLAAGIIFAGW